MIAVVVGSRTRETQDIIRVVFHAKEGVLPPYEAGAHIDVCLPSGLIRQYSLCRLQDDPRCYEVAVFKAHSSKGGSEEMHRLNVGETLMISAPKNHFRLATTPAKSLLIAGGIGVAPLIAMAQQLEQMMKPFEFHYCARTPDAAAFVAWLKAASFADKVHFYFSQVPTSGRMDILNVLSQQAISTELYLCGPTDFIQQLEWQAQTLGWSQERLHKEYFSGLSPVSKEDSNTRFTLKIHSTGEEFDVAPEQTITQVLDANGIYLPVSCEEGVCGTCQTKVCHGVPDHRDLFLSEKEKAAGGLIMPCCSRSKTSLLELDL